MQRPGRWSETYRILGLQGCELLLVGYNTPKAALPARPSARTTCRDSTTTLCMAAGAYQNGMFVVGVAKGGVEEGVELLAESQIIGPSGEVIAKAETNGDELVHAEIDLDLTARYKQTVFDFVRYRRPEMYGLITAPKA
ncbi:MAG: nitrilase-related carbon-nitrogen hydrolase [Acidimicrobiia bacterium]